VLPPNLTYKFTLEHFNGCKAFKIN